MIENIKNFFVSIGTTLLDLLIIAGIFFLAKKLVDIVSKITRKTMNNSEKLDNQLRTKEIKTSMSVAHSANRYIIYAIAIILSLNVVGLGQKVSSAIVAAGIGGLIISFGAQSIVKDIIAGIFLRFEKQYLIGDYIKLEEYEGVVESVSIRSTYLNSFGKRIVIPNGEIKSVVNYSKIDGLSMIHIPLPYSTDTRIALEIIDDAVNSFYKDNKNLLTAKKPVNAEIFDFKDLYVDILVRLDTKPLNQWTVERKLRLLIKEKLEENGIKLAYNKLADEKGKKIN